MRRLLLRNPLIRTELCGGSMRVGGIRKRFFGSPKTLDDIVVTSKCAQVGQKMIHSLS